MTAEIGSVDEPQQVDIEVISNSNTKHNKKRPLKQFSRSGDSVAARLLHENRVMSTFHRKYWLRFNPKWIQRANSDHIIRKNYLWRYLEGIMRIALIILNSYYILSGPFRDVNFLNINPSLHDVFLSVYFFQFWLEFAVFWVLILSTFAHLYRHDLWRLAANMNTLSGFSSLALTPSFSVVKNFFQSPVGVNLNKSWWQPYKAQREREIAVLAKKRRPRWSCSGKGPDFLAVLVLPFLFLVPLAKLVSVSAKTGSSFESTVVYLALVNQIAFLRDSSYSNGADIFLFRVFSFMPDLSQREKEREFFLDRLMRHNLYSKGYILGSLLALSQGPIDSAYIAHCRDAQVLLKSHNSYADPTSEPPPYAYP
eukprot:GHVR01181454.1.p1 GENE.GHVR01181454.1~~GHVR01181454.1.p1  ORF type:complete len:367 (+),score=21.59 GHVR01181454.1:1118-2218(+)